MPNLVLSISQMKITPFFWSMVLAFIISSFLFWRKLKAEDFEEEVIYQLTLILLISVLIFSLFFERVIKDFFVGAFWGAVLVVYLRLKKEKKDYWDGFEALTLPLLLSLLLGGVGEFLTLWKKWSISFIIVSLIGLILSFYIRRNYRRFYWYKSGKQGIVFLSVSAFVFLSFSVIAFFQKDALYLDKLLLISSFFACLVFIYKRSERKLREDLKDLFKRR